MFANPHTMNSMSGLFWKSRKQQIRIDFLVQHSIRFGIGNKETILLKFSKAPIPILSRIKAQNLIESCLLANICLFNLSTNFLLSPFPNGALIRDTIQIEILGKLSFAADEFFRIPFLFYRRKTLKQQIDLR